MSYAEPVTRAGLPDMRFRHGLDRRASPHRLRSRWHGMVQRCTNPNWINFEDYGGRGITVCDRWRSLRNFVEDMDSDFFVGAWLDRVDNDKGYESGNVRWSTPLANMNHTRASRLESFQGKTMTVAEWAREVGMNHRLLRVRLWRGWSFEKSITTP